MHVSFHEAKREAAPISRRDCRDRHDEQGGRRQNEDLQSISCEASGILAGRVRLGVLPAAGPYLLPQAIRKLHRDYPHVRLTAREKRGFSAPERLLLRDYSDRALSRHFAA